MLQPPLLVQCLLALQWISNKAQTCCDSAEHVLWYSWPRTAADPIALNPLRRAALPGAWGGCRDLCKLGFAEAAALPVP